MTPKGFHPLLGAIVLERWAFYGFLAIYALYRLAHGNDSTAAAKAVADVLALVYGSTFLGGLLGQRLGFRWTALAGTGLLGVAYVALAVGCPTWAWGGLLTLGIGLFKPSIPILVSRLHAGGDQLIRDAAMSRFYGAVNVGGFLGPLVAGALAGRGLFAWAFGLSGAAAWLAGVTLVVLAWPELEERTVAAEAFALSPAQVLSDLTPSPPSSYRWRWAAIASLCLLAVAFWTGYNSFFGTVEAWIESTVDRHVLGYLVPTAWFNAENGLVILLAAALVPGWMGRWSMWQRVALALMLSATAFAVLAYLGTGPHPAAYVPFLAVLLESVGELAVSPLGLSRVTSLAPPRWVGACTAAWYLSTSVGAWLSGRLTGFGTMVALSLVAAGATVAMVEIFRRAEAER